MIESSYGSSYHLSHEDKSETTGGNVETLAEFSFTGRNTSPQRLQVRSGGFHTTIDDPDTHT
jgi:hypothetical protein